VIIPTIHAKPIVFSKVTFPSTSRRSRYDRGAQTRSKEQGARIGREKTTDLFQLAHDVLEGVYLFVTVERLGRVVPVNAAFEVIEPVDHI
jgi:hypothetical protein